MGQNESTNKNVVVLDSKDLLAFSKYKNTPQSNLLSNIIEDTPIHTQSSQYEERKDDDYDKEKKKKDNKNKSRKTVNNYTNTHETYTSMDKSEINTNKQKDKENKDKNTVNTKVQFFNNNNNNNNNNDNNYKDTSNPESREQTTPDVVNTQSNRSKIKFKNKNTKYIKSFLDKSKSAFLELNLKDIQEGKDSKEGKHNTLNFDNFDLFVHEKDVEISESIFDSETNKLKNSLNKEFEYINMTITGEKKFKFPESRLETLSYIRTQFLIDGQKSDRHKAPAFQRKETRTLGLKSSENKLFNTTVRWGENNTEKAFKNELEKLDLEQRLMNQYRSEMLDVGDPSFINKFAIIMHKYENVSFVFFLI